MPGSSPRKVVDKKKLLSKAERIFLYSFFSEFVNILKFDFFRSFFLSLFYAIFFLCWPKYPHFFTFRSAAEQ